MLKFAICSDYANFVNGAAESRRYRTTSTNGRLLVSRDALQTAISDRIDSDFECGNDVSLSLPESLPSADYDQSHYGEIFVAYGTFEELDLDYLPCDLKDRLETSYQSLYFAIPYLSNGHSGLLILAEMSDTKNRLTPPLVTNDKYRFIVDTIDEDGESVTLRVGEDSLTLEVSKNVSCQTDENVGDDFDQVIGESLDNTCYPERFDWGCGSILGWDIGYCKAIKENLCEIQRYNGDVCMHATTSRSVRCPSTLIVTSMNGVFVKFFLDYLIHSHRKVLRQNGLIDTTVLVLSTLVCHKRNDGDPNGEFYIRPNETS
ncbi:hypothetical protein BSL78_22327 [Apostichopus japonicus]|uniref:Uncharacterized protein n=1 Tax=Stichopus japonicus TaxID=307972 RepID=A0A2G8JYG7_STIJA|nr:hypothetical protein BSL78_22327 [Apostichopus japonicus]